MKSRQGDLGWPSQRANGRRRNRWLRAVPYGTANVRPDADRDGNARPDKCGSNEDGHDAPSSPLMTVPSLLLAADRVQEHAFDLGHDRHDEAPPCEKCCLSWRSPRLTRLRATGSVTLR